jgi:hypothetical protein
VIFVHRFVEHLGGELPGLVPAERKRCEPTRFRARRLRGGASGRMAGRDLSLGSGAPLFSIHRTGRIWRTVIADSR